MDRSSENLSLQLEGTLLVLKNNNPFKHSSL